MVKDSDDEAGRNDEPWETRRRALRRLQMSQIPNEVFLLAARSDMADSRGFVQQFPDKHAATSIQRSVGH